jgi:response regulator RpfG family c-di-GMP phosphodiesterase
MILLVEDERQIRRFVRHALEQEGLRVLEAETRREGLLEAGRCQPDLVILDLGLPDGDGAKFVADFRLVIGAGAGAVGPFHRARQDRRARCRCRRLPDQALLHRRAAGPCAGAVAAGRGSRRRPW